MARKRGNGEDSSPIPSVSRRQFLLGAGGGAAAVAALGVAAGGPAAVAPQGRGVAQGPGAPVVRVNAGPVPAGYSLVRMKVNGTRYEVAAEPRMSLAQVLREQLGLTGTKVGCDRAECGTCTVIMEGLPVYACTVLGVEAEGKDITTIEGLSQAEEMHVLQRAFVQYGAVQCGFCSPGMIMAAKALLDVKKNPNEEDVRLALSGNLCRCTGYVKIIEAVLAASKMA